MNTDFIYKFLRENLSEKRLRHIEGVKKTAGYLAEKYGENPEKAEIAALFHDMYRKLSDSEIDFYIKKIGLEEYRYKSNPNLIHSKVAAFNMKEIYGIEDEDLINAVSFHTTGRAGMSKLEKIIFISDAVEPSRSYPSVGVLRNLAEHDLNRACLVSLESTVKFLEKEGIEIDRDTIEAREYFRKMMERVMNNNELAMLAAKAIDSKKGIDIKIIDIAAKSSFADCLIVASGSNDRQVGAIAEAVKEEYEKINIIPRSIAGKNNSGWILMDYGDIIINIFNPELRSRYNLENVWGDCEIKDYEAEQE